MSSRLRTLPPVVIASTGVPQLLFTLAPMPKTQSFKARANTANTGDVFIGDNAVNLAIGQGDLVGPGNAVSYQGDAGHTGGHRQLQIDNVYVAGNAGDKIHVTYLEYL